MYIVSYPIQILNPYPIHMVSAVCQRLALVPIRCIAAFLPWSNATSVSAQEWLGPSWQGVKQRTPQVASTAVKRKLQVQRSWGENSNLLLISFLYVVNSWERENLWHGPSNQMGTGMYPVSLHHSGTMSLLKAPGCHAHLATQLPSYFSAGYTIYWAVSLTKQQCKLT